MIYLASPYSHPNKHIELQRFKRAEAFVADAIRQHLIIYSPIVYCHQMALAYDLPGDAAFWDGFNMNMLRRSDAMWVLQLEGWAESKGVRRELSVAQTLHMTIRHIEISYEDN